MNNIWTMDNSLKTKIALLTLGELKALQEAAPDAMLTCIDGRSVRSKDCNDDTRCGYVAYGQPIGMIGDQHG